MSYRRMAALKTTEDFRTYAAKLGLDLPFDDEVEAGRTAPLSQPVEYSGRTIGNRFAVLPMEGWDAAPDGQPTDLVRRRWERFGQSGAKLVWGGEAVAVRHDGRANPNQLVINEETTGALADLRRRLVAAHGQRWPTDDLYIGLQLTHSGRFCRPNEKARTEPFILYHHPILDRKFGLAADYPLMTDEQIEALVDDYVRAACLAQQAGFDFVDLKHCHGYLGHEFLSAVTRPGRYGGSFENRTRFLRELVVGIRRAAPGLELGVRLSAFDMIPFRPGADRVGEPEPWAGRYPYAFGGDGTGLGIDLAEPLAFAGLLTELGIRLLCLTGGSPYYTPHIQRPALFPPSDGYQPPEDPLVGVARQIAVAAEIKRRHPELIVVGSAYSYLQEWLPNVAQAVIRSGRADFVGLGRMVLPYPEFAADVVDGRTLQRKHICRTFSDCTTAPRNGLVSGCYPLDEFYRNGPHYRELEEAKHKSRQEAYQADSTNVNQCSIDARSRHGKRGGVVV